MEALQEKETISLTSNCPITLSINHQFFLALSWSFQPATSLFDLSTSSITAVQNLGISWLPENPLSVYFSAFWAFSGSACFKWNIYLHCSFVHMSSTIRCMARPLKKIFYHFLMTRNHICFVSPHFLTHMNLKFWTVMSYKISCSNQLFLNLKNQNFLKLWWWLIMAK